ncbi:hypothetical protein BB558_002770 [Smittium angustum]|uniref:Uncharacterized protein n=1 Tax=Smittium angustum TaxID=133377 RepID=A0A2U1IV08_SMIAN|nr:hypothetical protein BB558_007444 [Smittium angustum]PWA01155.1 hypothetical protein BB558_002770 [Smittium angustum]
MGSSLSKSPKRHLARNIKLPGNEPKIIRPELNDKEIESTQSKDKADQEIYLQNLSFLINPKVTDLKTPVTDTKQNVELETVKNREDIDDFEQSLVKNKLTAHKLHMLLLKSNETAFDKNMAKKELEELAKTYSIDTEILESLNKYYKPL